MRLDRHRWLPRTGRGVMIGSFALAIVAGTILLALPMSHRSVEVSLLDALFTATSATCVTGLVVHDTGSTFSTTGQVVILVLIQLGGLGILTFAALAMQRLGFGASLSSRQGLADSFAEQGRATGLVTRVAHIIAVVLVIELVGAMLLVGPMAHHGSSGEAAWLALFHSISAFCNAGFSLFDDSLARFSESPYALGVISFLIVVGGIGHGVIVEVIGKARSFVLRRHEGPRHRLSVGSTIALATTGILLVGGAAFIWIGHLAADDGAALSSTGVMGSVFQSVTARTAGFEAMAQGSLPLGVVTVTILLMSVGGSPGSCAGGIKTTTVAVWATELWHRLHGRREPTLCKRTIGHRTLGRVRRIVGLALVWNVVGVVLLSITEGPHGASLEAIAFEQVSAFATVGLSVGLTAKLTTIGKLWIIVTMFVGRLGPLTIATWLMDEPTVAITFAHEEVPVG